MSADLDLPSGHWSRPVEIGDATVTRVLSPGRDGCQHQAIELIEDGGIVRCRPCGVQLSPFWALVSLHEQLHWERSKLDSRKRALDAVAASRLTFIAAKRVEQAWRRRGTLPGCPHCGRGILATDAFKRVSKDGELEQRQSDAARKDQERAWSAKA